MRSGINIILCLILTLWGFQAWAGRVWTGKTTPVSGDLHLTRIQIIPIKSGLIIPEEVKIVAKVKCEGPVDCFCAPVALYEGFTAANFAAATREVERKPITMCNRKLLVTRRYIPKGSVCTVIFTRSVPRSAIRVSYEAKVDPDNKIKEPNENNNSKSASIRIKRKRLVPPPNPNTLDTLGRRHQLPNFLQRGSSGSQQSSTQCNSMIKRGEAPTITVTINP